MPMRAGIKERLQNHSFYGQTLASKSNASCLRKKKTYEMIVKAQVIERQRGRERELEVIGYLNLKSRLMISNQK